jgi:hypothetical protein
MSEKSLEKSQAFFLKKDLVSAGSGKVEAYAGYGC